MMRLAIRSLVWEKADTCRATFETVDGLSVEAVFRLERSAVGTLAWPEPDIFRDCDGTADEVRQVTATVVRFCLLAQRESPD